jgi:hypothetical protein
MGLGEVDCRVTRLEDGRGAMMARFRFRCRCGIALGDGSL